MMGVQKAFKPVGTREATTLQRDNTRHGKYSERSTINEVANGDAEARKGYLLPRGEGTPGDHTRKDGPAAACKHASWYCSKLIVS